MTFNSWQFLIFFPLTTCLYFLSRPQDRTILLLVASCIFYMVFYPPYLLILLFTIVVDYLAGLGIEASKSRAKKLLLLASLAANLGCLAFFKYFSFLCSTFVGVGRVMGFSIENPALSILLPIGLSFHTFQAMSYTLEVYWGRQKAERHFWTYALYVMFYPQLVAGPIERPAHLLPQFKETHRFDAARLISGLRRMLWGFFKKIVIADRLAVTVNTVFADVRQHDGPTLLIAVLFFAFQIYCDFSAYSDIAIGAAKSIGFDLMENFDSPYFARSVSEFWTRWHISLSRWFRDYVYIPLGGNRVSPPAWCVNILITFLLSGLWHGANWTFVLWGGLNGFYLLIEKALSPLGRFLNDRAKTLLTFSAICFSWIFFRSSSLEDAGYILTHLSQNFSEILSPVYRSRLFSVANLGLTRSQLALAAVFIGTLLLAEHLTRGTHPAVSSGRESAWHRWGISYVLCLAVLLFGVFHHSQFIYFQF